MRRVGVGPGKVARHRVALAKLAEADMKSPLGDVTARLGRQAGV